MCSLVCGERQALYPPPPPPPALHHNFLPPHPLLPPAGSVSGARLGAAAVDFRRQMGVCRQLSFAVRWLERLRAAALSHVWVCGDVICVWSCVSERARGGGGEEGGGEEGVVWGRGRLSCSHKIITRDNSCTVSLCNSVWWQSRGFI